eukprot:TRINITY_DN32362_c0_g1_i1.p1 TRINITY_DN32362_c0_g1~~TRINITY_DN32362_c0_g1_i1.p1  ORF type:complete len:424 (-),score=104.50 TRINITY_DN32362_c0_g1_i1:95-1366(-)
MASSCMACVLVASMCAAALGAKVSSSAQLSQAQFLTFEDFVAKHSRSYSNSSEEYQERKLLFERRKKFVLDHNSKKGTLWVAAVNKFSDAKEAELEAMHGYKPSHKEHQARSKLSFAEMEEHHEHQRRTLPEKVDWRHLRAAEKIEEQGSCGSCWAISAVSVLNAHVEIHQGAVKRFSSQEMVNCVPNPRKCGGEGGCRGATVELGLDWAVKNGLSLEAAVPYEGQDSLCGNTKSLLQVGLRGSGNSGASFGLTGFRVLPSNKYEPLLRAVTDVGPVAVSAAANNWFAYDNGIFDDCDNVINHAVTLYGYGRSSLHKYWLVKNSWGSDWGEKGFIRILRHDNEEEFCGIDNEPEKGVACEGGPTQITVCGTCGILYDSVVPEFEDVQEKTAAFVDFSDTLETSSSEDRLEEAIERLSHSRRHS